MDIDIIKDNTLIGSLTDVQFQIFRPYDENGETYVTLTVMQKIERSYCKNKSINA